MAAAAAAAAMMVTTELLMEWSMPCELFGGRVPGFSEA